jgi:ABC-type arginine/histidine transport system permease subunit
MEFLYIRLISYHAQFFSLFCRDYQVWHWLHTQKGQIEAAQSWVFKKMAIFKDIVLPQAIAKVYPSLNSQFIFLFLTTGLISKIDIEDIT